MCRPPRKRCDPKHQPDLSTPSHTFGLAFRDLGVTGSPRMRHAAYRCRRATCMEMVFSRHPPTAEEIVREMLHRTSGCSRVVQASADQLRRAPSWAVLESDLYPEQVVVDVVDPSQPHSCGRSVHRQQHESSTRSRLCGPIFRQLNEPR